jgi:hypothetical protein
VMVPGPRQPAQHSEAEHPGEEGEEVGHFHGSVRHAQIQLFSVDVSTGWANGAPGVPNAALVACTASAPCSCQMA